MNMSGDGNKRSPDDERAEASFRHFGKEALLLGIELFNVHVGPDPIVRCRRVPLAGDVFGEE